MSYKMNRRKFLTYVGCGCCGFMINSCTSAPITERKQLKLIPEAKLKAQAAQIYEKVKEKEKLIKDTQSIKEIKEIGKKWRTQYQFILINQIFQIQLPILIGNIF